MTNSAQAFEASLADLGIPFFEEGGPRTADPYAIPIRHARSAPCGSVGQTKRAADMNSACFTAIALDRLGSARRVGALAQAGLDSVGGMRSLPGNVGAFVCGLDFVGGGAGVSGPTDGTRLGTALANQAAAHAALDAANAAIAAGGTDFPAQMQAVTDAANADAEAQSAAAAAGAMAGSSIADQILAEAHPAPAPQHAAPTPAPKAPVAPPPPLAKKGLFGIGTTTLLLGAGAAALVFHKKLGF